MTLADWCLLVAAILPLAAIGPAKWGGGYDNRNPRNPEFYRTGFRARAWAAHLNGYESFPFFAAAVLLAEMRAAPQGTVDLLAALYVLARVGYVGAYYADRPTLRSGLWAAGFLLNLAIFTLPAFGR